MRPTLLSLLALSVAVAGATAYRRFQRGRALPVGLIQVNGRIEGDSFVIAGKQAGRVDALLAREGDHVNVGQTLIRLDGSFARARLAQAVAARDVALARAEAARAQLLVLRHEVPVHTGGARATLLAADAALAQAAAATAQAQRDRVRAQSLFESHSIDAAEMERAELALALATQNSTAARASRLQALQALADARLGGQRVQAKEAEVAALDASARQAQALVDEAQSAVDDLTITSPTAGTVTARFVDVGEIVNAGTPALEIVDLDRLYLKVFVPEADVGKLHLGLPARIHTDAFPERFSPAEVRHIAARAEFTPKEVQTRDERVKLVYAVKLYATDNRDRRLTPGLSGDAVIRWQESAPWVGPRL